jgi:hypothetical protein
MAISAPTKSAQYTNRTATPPVLNDGRDDGPVFFKFAKLTFTAAGFTTAAAGDLKLQRMPAGKVRIYGALSRLICPAGTGTSDLDLGIGAYVKADGTVQALQGAFLADSVDVGGGAIDTDLNAAAGGADYKEITSKSGFDIVASFDTANSPAAGDLIVVIAYTHDAQGA